MDTNTYHVVGTVPIPSAAKTNSFPFDTMKVGDSFDIGSTKPKTVKTAAARFTKKTGWRFTVRFPDGTLCKTRRCWRIE